MRICHPDRYPLKYKGTTIGRMVRVLFTTAIRELSILNEYSLIFIARANAKYHQ